MRVKLFITGKKKDEANGAASSSSSSSSAPAADLLNSDNDFKPTPAQIAAAAEKTMKCPYCHQMWERVLITREYDTKSNDPRTQPPSTSSFGLSTDARYNLRTWAYDAKLNIYFENDQVKSRYFMMAGTYCVLCFNLQEAFSRGGNPAKKYDKVHFFLNQEQLEEHLKSKHDCYLCSACMNTRKIFIHEHQVFTRKELTHHFKFGSNSSIQTEYQPSGQAHSGTIEPHPFCPFCEKPYYSSDELYAHLITVHRSCRFCASEGFNRYFISDSALRSHFAQKHYLCEEGKCRKVEANHAAFRDVLALKAHKLSAHTEGLSKEEIKRMQTIDLDLFRREPYQRRPQHMDERKGGRKRDQIEEFEFRTDEPPTYSSSRIDSSSSSGPFYEDDGGVTHRMEDFPSLGGGPAGAATAAAHAAAHASAVHRSQSQPMGFRNLQSEEAYPSLGGSSNIASAASSSGSAASFRGVPPSRDEFPTLRSVVKGEQKFQAKQQAAQQLVQQQQRKKALTPQPQTHTPIVDNRTNSTVPLPLPAAASPSELPSRTKSLVAALKQAMLDDADAFEKFKQISGRFRSGEMSTKAYLDEFYRLLEHNPSGALSTEKLLIELLATLQDEQQRYELHGEYARRKVEQRMEGIRKGLKAEKTGESNAAAISAAAQSAADAKLAKNEAKKARAQAAEDAELAAAASTLAVSSAGPPRKASPAPAPSVSPRPAVSFTATAAASNPVVAPAAAAATSSKDPTPSEAFTTVESKSVTRAIKSTARKAAAAQGIGAFEGRSAKPLSKEDEDANDLVSVIARQKEKEEAEARELQRQQEAAEKAEAAERARKVAESKKGWTGPPGFATSAAPSASTKMVRQNSWDALEDEDGTAEVAEKKSTPPKKRSAPLSAYQAPEADEESEDLPPLPSSSPAPSTQLPDPSSLDQHLATISALKIPGPSKGKLQFLATIFFEVQNLIAERHGEINAPGE